MALQGQVAVVGATGVVGGEVLALLAERGHPGERVSAYATERAAGTEVEYGDESLEVETLSAEALRNTSVVFLATPAAVSREWAPRAQAAGAWVVDSSDAFRAQAEVPLAMPGFPVPLPSRGRVVACASPVVASVLGVLAPLKEAFGVASATVTALMGAASAGKGGVAELERQTVDLMSGREPEPKLFAHRLAFNLVPQVGTFGGDGLSTGEESGWWEQAQRLWPSAPPLSGTALQVPVFFGHVTCLDVELKGRATVEQVRACLSSAKGLKVLDTPAERIYPMPMLVTADPSIHIGRIRSIPAHPERVLLLAAFEGARRVALAAVDAAESLTQPRA